MVTTHADFWRRGGPARSDGGGLARACRDRARLQRSIDVMPLTWAAGLFAVALVLLLGLKLRRGAPYFLVGSAMWVVALESGIEPLVVGQCGHRDRRRLPRA